jgi:hypothetical protein
LGKYAFGADSNRNPKGCSTKKPMTKTIQRYMTVNPFLCSFSILNVVNAKCALRQGVAIATTIRKAKMVDVSESNAFTANR